MSSLQEIQTVLDAEFCPWLAIIFVSILYPRTINIFADVGRSYKTIICL